MLCTAPGVIVRRALRRNFLPDNEVPVDYFDRCFTNCPYDLVMETYPSLRGRSPINCDNFTLHLPVFGVEHGRLGEVVSLVGDCRPPPPGNPRQPTCSLSVNFEHGKSHKVLDHLACRVNNFHPKIFKKGRGYFYHWEVFSLYIALISENLKELIHLQYFKKNRSFFSCSEVNTVLEFGHVYSHLCGFQVVNPLSIVITNVLLS